MPVSSTVLLSSASPHDTRNIGRRIGRALAPGDVVLLHGDLGAGKTTLTQGIAEGLGVATPVQSPTFVLVHEHAGKTANGAFAALHHLDLYRLSGEDEVEAIGYDEFIAPADGVSVVEWPERAGGLLPDRYLLVEIRAGIADERQITLSASGPDDVVARWLAPFRGQRAAGGDAFPSNPPQGT